MLIIKMTSMFLLYQHINLMDCEKPGRLERSSSEQSLQFNPFLEEIGFYKQTKEYEDEYEDTENNKACRQMIQSIRSCKEDIDATYQRFQYQQIVKNESQPIFKEESEGDAHSSQQQFVPYSKQTPTELKTILQAVNIKLKALFNQIEQNRSQRQIAQEIVNTKNVDLVEKHHQETSQVIQRCDSQNKQKGIVFSPIFVKPIRQPRQRLHNRIRKITNKKQSYNVSQKIKRPIFPLAKAQQLIYFNKPCFPSDKQTKINFEAENLEEMVKIKRFEQKRSVQAIQLAVFQAYKEDNQYIVQQSIAYLAQISSKENFINMKKEVLSKESIESYCRQLKNTGIGAFVKYSTQILQKRINQILLQYSQDPIEGVDIKMQILSHFFKSSNTFNEYRLIKQQKKDGLELSSHLKMLNYSPAQLNNLKYYFLKHQHKIKYFDGGFNIEKIANAYIFLLKKIKLQTLRGQSLSLLPKKQLVAYVKAQRKQLISKKPVRIEQNQRKYFSSFASKVKNRHNRKREWTSQHILVVANQFSKLIDNSQDVIMDEIKQITKRFGKTFKINCQLFQKYKSRMIKFSHQSPQLTVKDKNYQIRRYLNHNPGMTMLQLQKRIFFKEGIYVSIQEIVENIDYQLQILIKQLLFEYMGNVIYQMSKQSMRLPIAFIDTFTTKLQLQLQQDEVFGGQSRIQSKQVTFCFAVSSDGCAICKIFFGNENLELILSSMIYHLDRIYTFAFNDAQFFCQNWFQRRSIKQLQRRKNIVIPIPSLASMPNPCKIIRQRLQKEVNSHHHSQTSLKLLTQNIVNQFESQSIRRIFAQDLSQSKLLFKQLKEKQLKSFEATRPFEFQEMKLVINRDFSPIQQYQTTIMLKRQTRQIQSLRPLISQSQRCQKDSFIGQNLKDDGYKRYLLQEEITEAIRRMSLEDRRKAVDFLLFYNEKQTVLAIQPARQQFNL